MQPGYRKGFGVFIRQSMLAIAIGLAAQPAIAGFSFGYGFPGLSFGYRDHGHYRGGHFGFHQPYVVPRFHHRYGHALPRYRGGISPHSYRPYRHYRPRRFYRPHRFHRYRRY